MKLTVGDYKFKIHWTPILALLAVLYLLLSGKLGRLLREWGTALQAAWNRYGRFVETHDSVVNLLTLCVFLIALTLSIRVVLEGRRGD